MTSGIFERVRLFTDVEGITLEKWLDADNAGQDDLAKKILDAGLLVEHMIAEIPLDQNLADNSELRQLAENADQVFGLIVCFGCNRAFDNKDDQARTCPNCGAKLSRPQLTPSEIKKHTSNNLSAKNANMHDLTRTDHAVRVEKKETMTEKPNRQSSSKSKKHPQNKESGKNYTKDKEKNNKHAGPSEPPAPLPLKDEKEEGWSRFTGQEITERRSVKSR